MTEPMIIFALISIGFLNIVGLVIGVITLVTHSDLAHSIEDLKHFTLLSRAETTPPETMARFLNPKPMMPGDIKITFPNRFVSEESF